MNTIIYYFTGTGNSLKVAQIIAKKLDNCELVPIAKIMYKENLKSTSAKVGFIFPLYYAGLPKIVYDFVERLDLDSSNYIFSVITNAGDINELPLQQLEKILKPKKKMLSAAFLITMPNNYIIGYDIHSEERQKEFFKKAKDQIENICEYVKNKTKNLTPEIFEKDVSRSEKMNNQFRKKVNGTDKLFYVEDNCNSCGICEKVCPVNNIILIKGSPKWQHKCQQCLACINFCPEKSIQFGKNTLKTQRYHHPEITLQEMVNQK